MACGLFGVVNKSKHKDTAGDNVALKKTPICEIAEGVPWTTISQDGTYKQQLENPDIVRLKVLKICQTDVRIDQKYLTMNLKCYMEKLLYKVQSKGPLLSPITFQFLQGLCVPLPQEEGHAAWPQLRERCDQSPRKEQIGGLNQAGSWNRDPNPPVQALIIDLHHRAPDAVTKWLLDLKSLSTKMCGFLSPTVRITQQRYTA